MVNSASSPILMEETAAAFVWDSATASPPMVRGRSPRFSVKCGKSRRSALKEKAAAEADERAALQASEQAARAAQLEADHAAAAEAAEAASTAERRRRLAARVSAVKTAAAAHKAAERYGREYEGACARHKAAKARLNRNWEGGDFRECQEDLDLLLAQKPESECVDPN